jgi:hypothetical protein
LSQTCASAPKFNQLLAPRAQAQLNLVVVHKRRLALVAQLRPGPVIRLVGVKDRVSENGHHGTAFATWQQFRDFFPLPHGQRKFIPSAFVRVRIGRLSLGSKAPRIFFAWFFL